MKNIRIVIFMVVVMLAACGREQKAIVNMNTSKSPQTGYASVNGIKMYYEIHGTGKPLVLIHGGGSTIQTSFATILPLLSEHYKVIAVELQAHGHTSDRNAPESFEQDADDVAELMKFLKIEKADIMGFSNGGNTSMKIAMRHPALVNKIILVSSFYKRDGMFPGFFDGMGKATIGNMPQHLKDAFLAINKDSTALQTMFEKDRSRMLHFVDWKDEELAAIKAPALIIIGDRDVVIPEHAVEMSHVIRNSELMILPGDHGSFIGEGMSAKIKSDIPVLTVAVIREFLNK